MQPVIIADASCLILLDKIEELILLQYLYGQILITQIVADEFGVELPEWILIKDPKDRSRQALFELSVDRGEASAIALAVETSNCLLVMDDLPGRKLAKQLNVDVTGTLGIIADAKIKGIIPSVKPLLDKIKRTNFRIDERLISFILRRANE